MFSWTLFSRKGLQSIDESNARLNIWEGAVRSSKTICSIVRWLEFIATAPAGNLLMIGKTERTLRRNILDPIRDIVGKRNFRSNYGNGEVWICGRHIYLAGANDERAEGKIRGMTLVGAYGDELTLWPESFFAMLLSRLSVKGAKFFGTTNPDSPHHWLMKNYLKRGSLNLKCFHFDLDDNLSLDEQYKTELKKEYTGLWFKRYILGLWVVAEGAIYDCFDESIHVVPRAKLPRMRRYWVTCDYGTTNPSVFLLCGEGEDKKFYIVSEWRYDSSQHHGRQMTDAQQSKALRQWLASYRDKENRAIKPKWVFVDPSAASFKVQLFHDGVRGVVDADNAVLDGIRRTSSLIGVGRLLICADCVGLNEEIMGYVWNPKAAKNGEDEPLKQADHGPDAVRYFVNGTRYVWQAWVNNRETEEAKEPTEQVPMAA